MNDRTRELFLLFRQTLWTNNCVSNIPIVTIVQHFFDVSVSVKARKQEMKRQERIICHDFAKFVSK